MTSPSRQNNNITGLHRDQMALLVTIFGIIGRCSPNAKDRRSLEDAIALMGIRMEVWLWDVAPCSELVPFVSGEEVCCCLFCDGLREDVAVEEHWEYIVRCECRGGEVVGFWFCCHGCGSQEEGVG